MERGLKKKHHFFRFEASRALPTCTRAQKRKKQTVFFFLSIFFARWQLSFLFLDFFSAVLFCLYCPREKCVVVVIFLFFIVLGALFEQRKEVAFFFLVFFFIYFDLASFRPLIPILPFFSASKALADFFFLFQPPSARNGGMKRCQRARSTTILQNHLF